METSILQQIRKRAGNVIEPHLLKTGRVLAVRTCSHASIMEIDLHLPTIDMRRWRGIPYIKFKVADLTYRDYTPSGWDAETSTCTLYIDTAHRGMGSSWALQLQKNDIAQYLKVGSTHDIMQSTSIVGLGDESSTGHLLALKQMAAPIVRFSGAVKVTNIYRQELLNKYFKSSIELIPKDDNSSILNWVATQQFDITNTCFYITGNYKLVTELRKLLKQMGVVPNKIKATGFWH